MICACVGVRGGFFFLLVFCLPNVCVQERRCCSIASLFLLFSVPSSGQLLVVVSYGLLLVTGLWFRFCLCGMHVHTCTCEPWALAVLSPSVFWLEATVGFNLSLTFSIVLVIMADAQVGRCRRVANAEDGEHARSVRARMTDAEGRLDTVESTLVGEARNPIAVH